MVHGVCQDPPSTYAQLTRNSMSAQLGALTSNKTYTDAAVLAASFFERQLLSTELSIPTYWTGLNTYDCTPDKEIWSSSAGMVIEAYSILADTTGDAKWREMFVSSSCSSRNDIEVLSVQSIWY
jgi:hypothetical protein